MYRLVRKYGTGDIEINGCGTIFSIIVSMG